MNASIDRHFHIDPDTNAHDLLNAANEWLQYARSLNRLVIDLVREAGRVDGKRMTYALETVDALMGIGVRCAAEAHERMIWEQSQPLRTAQN